MTIAVLLIAAAGLLVSVGRVWLYASVGGGEQPLVSASLTGRTLAPVAAGAALLLLAGSAGVIGTRGWGRTVVGVMLVLVALAALAVSASFGLGAPESGRSRAVADLGAEGLALRATSWWIGAACSAGVAALAAVAVVLRGRTWAVMGSRYDRRSTGIGRASNGSSDAVAAPSGGGGTLTSAQLWDALDRGEDPTAETDLPQ